MRDVLHARDGVEEDDSSFRSRGRVQAEQLHLVLGTTLKARTTTFDAPKSASSSSTRGLCAV